MNSESKHNYENYFDEDPVEEAKFEKPQTKKKDEEVYKMPKPRSKKSKNKSELNEINLDDYNLVEDDDDFIDLKNELDIQYLEENGYKFVPLDQLKNYLPEEEINKIDQEEVVLSPEQEISTLEQYLQSNPCDYNCLVKLIEIYRQCGIKDKLKEIRNYTQNLFPLSQEMWLDWISDEFQTIPKDDFEQIFNFKEMYSKSISDFYYIKLCKKYLKYLITLLSEIENKKLEEKYNFSYLNIRQVFEELLELWGLDFNNSSKLWDLYLNFEKSLLKKFSSSNNEIEASKSFQLIRSIYRRRLSFPHVDVDIVWNEYSKWETDEDEKNKVEKKYKDSSQIVSFFINFEEKLGDVVSQTMKDNNSTNLREFLNTELPKLANKNFNYIRLYYERVLQMNPDDEDIWGNLINLAQSKEYKLSNKAIINILLRACKCCYFKVDFWIILLREMEKQGTDRADIEKKISEAYLSAENDRAKYEIWKYSLEYGCRQYNGVEESLVTLRADFDKCISQVSSFENNEYLLKIYLIWAEFETYKTQDNEKMKDIMEKVIRISGENTYWGIYLQYLKHFGVLKDIRSIYKRACQYSKEEKLVFSQKWISWEKIFGTAAEIEAALLFGKRVAEKEKSKSRVLKTKKKSTSTNIQSQDENMVDESNNRNEEIDESNKENVVYKKEIVREKKPKLVKKKKIELKPQEEIEEIDNEDDENEEKYTIFVNNIPPTISDDELYQFILQQNKKINIKECRVVKDKNGKSRGFAFVDLKDIRNAEKCVKSLNKQVLDGYEISCAMSKPPSSGENDSRTIFVNNLPFSIDENRVSEVFSKCGDILDIRIIRDKITNKPKGYCYVEFQNEESVNEAMSLTDLRIDGRKVIIKRSESDVKVREKLQYVVYITNLSYETREDDLKSFFTNYGINNINDIHIVKDEEGSSKGFAFVQFENEENMKKALTLTGKLLNNRAITVKVSKRNITKKRESESNLEDELKYSKRKKFDDKHKKTKFEISDETNNTSKEKTSWSNEDFQKLLMNKK